MPLVLSQFKLNRAVFEVRYASAFLLWDRAGITWHKLKRKYPEMKVAGNPGPNTQQISLAPDLLAEVHLDRANVHSLRVGKIESFASTCDDVFRELVDALEVTDFSRLGFRQYFEK